MKSIMTYKKSILCLVEDGTIIKSLQGNAWENQNDLRFLRGHRDVIEEEIDELQVSLLMIGGGKLR